MCLHVLPLFMIVVQLCCVLGFFLFVDWRIWVFHVCVLIDVSGLPCFTYVFMRDFVLFSIVYVDWCNCCVFRVCLSNGFACVTCVVLIYIYMFVYVAVMCCVHWCC